jgi:hypothetical protein
MELIKFNDTCRILRATGEVDALDNEAFDEVYNGPCSYQKGGQTAYSIATRDDLVYLPTNDVLIYANDVVEATTESGRTEGGVVKTPRDIRFGLSDEKITQLKLKQAKGE